MKHFLILLIFLTSCSTTQKKDQSDYADSNVKVLEYGDRLYAFRVHSDSINKCFFKEYDDMQLLNHYINYETLNPDNLDPIPRKVVKRNTAGILQARLGNQTNTKIVLKVSIDKLGRVVAAEMLEETTAIISQKQKRLILAETLGYHYESNKEGLCIESGKLTIILRDINSINSRE